MARFSGRRVTDWLPWVVGAVASLFYVYTAAPGIVELFDDSLEFQLIGPTFGIAHPTGYPLYTVVGGLWIRILFPIGNWAWRMNVFSALAAGMTVGMVSAIAQRLATDWHGRANAWAGLAAAIFAAEQRKGRTVQVLDGARSIGAKILVSGGGRCNVTHEVVTPDDFHGNRHIIRNVLAAFGPESTRRWFAAISVELKREPTGKLFPVTDRARTVLEALTVRCRDLGVVLSPGHRVTGIHRDQPNSESTACQSPFRIQHDHGALLATRVILATGGRSLPRTGSDGLGYELARNLGHQVTITAPALVPSPTRMLDAGPARATAPPSMT